MRRFLVLCALLFGCGGSDDHESDFICDPADRSGTYLFHYSERANGTCGVIPDEVGRLDPTAALPAGCALDAPDTWSADQCRFDRSFTCCEGAFCTTVVGSTTQQTEGASVISGLLTMRIEERDPLGNPIDACVSTYDFTATRQ